MNINNLTIGILAHVDSGKTTLAEGLLYTSGSILKPGRVDHGNTFLDTHALEQNRGITIFSKQAVLTVGDKIITLMDTPGHVDFSAEMERTLPILDYAILVVNAADGVGGHAFTLWKLLKHHKIPTFIFVNKMDQTTSDKEALLQDFKIKLGENCIDFSNTNSISFQESMAMCDEELLEEHLQGKIITTSSIAELVIQRKIFPCYFGSALKLEGIAEFLQGITSYTSCPSYPDEFAAKVFKITRDEQGNRLTHMKLTGGSLKVKMPIGEQKVDQIRIYSGTKYEAVQEAAAGMICAVTGLQDSKAGEGIGVGQSNASFFLEPVLTYRLLLSEGSDVFSAFLKLKQLEEEEPTLHLVWMESLNEIHVQVMGEIQMEILKTLMKERFQLDAAFDTGNIVYKESITNTVEGVGHFEPLRHYAEVHLLMEPAERGAGILLQNNCHEDMLDNNWQKLIMSHLSERKHPGVLTGSDLTDVKITLIAGRAHPKHTEGGDFRQATYRAIRQGLKNAESILLEPVYEFILEVPTSVLGRAMTDIQNMHGNFLAPETDGEFSILTGTVPVVTMNGYHIQVASYTKAAGRLFCSLKGYEPCHNQEEILLECGYDSEKDLENPTGSIFCSHGAGFFVPWNEVETHMHIENKIFAQAKEAMVSEIKLTETKRKEPQKEQEELEEIFRRTYGISKREKERADSFASPQRSGQLVKTVVPKRKEVLDEYLLVDGYNIIFAWEDLKELAEMDIEAARGSLMDILCNYQAIKNNKIILVFDAYKVKGNPGEVTTYKNIHLVYTKEAETADQYIEKTVHAIGRKYDVTVATSDALEQMIIMANGGKRLSALGFREEIEAARTELKDIWNAKRENNKNYLFHHLPEEMAELMEEVRLGKKSFDEKEHIK